MSSSPHQILMPPSPATSDSEEDDQAPVPSKMAPASQILKALTNPASKYTSIFRTGPTVSTSVSLAGLSVPRVMGAYTQPQQSTQGTRSAGPSTLCGRPPLQQRDRSRVKVPAMRQMGNASAGANRPNAFHPARRLQRKNPINFEYVHIPGAEFVDNIVGRDSEKFKVHKAHKAAIAHYSSFFSNAFDRQVYIEGETKTMVLKDKEERVFGAFVNWLYTQNIESPNMIPLTLMELAQLWTYGGTWKISTLQNQVMGMLVPMLSALSEAPAKDQRTKLGDFITYTFATKASTALKKLAIHKLMSFAPAVDESVNVWMKLFPAEVLMDLTAELLKWAAGLPRNIRHPQLVVNGYQIPTNAEFVDLRQ